jgi:hypothetical protein
VLHQQSWLVTWRLDANVVGLAMMQKQSLSSGRMDMSDMMHTHCPLCGISMDIRSLVYDKEGCWDCLTFGEQEPVTYDDLISDQDAAVAELLDEEYSFAIPCKACLTNVPVPMELVGSGLIVYCGLECFALRG